jgi:hypothetical protein
MSQINFFLTHLRCDGVTDGAFWSEDDEVYYLLTAVPHDANGTSLGPPVTSRGPDPSQGADADPVDNKGTAWDMGTGGSQQDRELNALLGSFTVDPSAFLNLTFVMLESDGTSIGDKIKLGVEIGGAVVGGLAGLGALSAATAAAGAAIGAAVGTLASMLPVNNDDRVGTLSLELRGEQDGSVSVVDVRVNDSNTRIIRVARRGDPFDVDVQFTGAGSNYTAHLVVTGTTARLATHVPVQGRLSLESCNYPGRWIRHQNFLGELTTVSTALDMADSTFTVRSGLADSGGVSFESVNYPGHYLRHQNFRLKLHPSDGSPLFAADATFHAVGGLADVNGVSLESHNYPNHFVRHRGFDVWVEDAGAVPETPLDQDATFRVTPALG